MAENENTVVDAPQAEEQPDAPTTQELEAALAEREARIQALEQEVVGLREQLELALERYRDSLLKASPEVPEEMVQGDTVREVEEAHARARAMVERIRSQLEAKQARERVPPGAPLRTAPDLSGLSAREKIAQGLSRR
ncbi:MAG: hypothetical protein Q8O40_02710 [Chloroflexota bacterium]|nr:hypothetical protein [Chloroflexota bacterium]